VEFENEAWISNHYEINPNSLPQEIQISDPLLMGTYFSLQLGVTRIMLAKFHQIPRFWKIFSKFLSKFNS
jgi:hypothetical protein